MPVLLHGEVPWDEPWFAKELAYLDAEGIGWVWCLRGVRSRAYSSFPVYTVADASPLLHTDRPLSAVIPDIESLPLHPEWHELVVSNPHPALLNHRVLDELVLRVGLDDAAGCTLYVQAGDKDQALAASAKAVVPWTVREA